MRINKLLSNYGICSRKEANSIIQNGRIMINNVLAFEGQWVEESDNILLDNKPIKKAPPVYIAFNKPRGIICTASKEKENNIIDFLNLPYYVFPIGRLDKDSEGLIILTNDGDFSNLILSSENFHEKEYLVTVDKDFNDDFLKNMSSGVKILNTITRPCKITRVSNNTFKIILTQGLNRQIRRMCKYFGYTVLSLKRIRILNIHLDSIPSGKYIHIDNSIISKILNSK